ncbi:MAG: hypothetical protein ACYC33_10235 [Thermoleophilia bacterium]
MSADDDVLPVIAVHVNGIVTGHPSQVRLAPQARRTVGAGPERESNRNLTAVPSGGLK